jgi:hypothetical protein
VGGGVGPCLTYDVNGNIFMSYGAIDQSGKIRAPERSSSPPRARNSCCRRGGVARGRVWNIASSCVSLHRRSTSSGTAGFNSGPINADHVQDSRRRNRASARVFFGQWDYTERDRNARNQSISCLIKQEWLSAKGGSLLKSILTTSSIVCFFTNCNKRMRSLFPIMFASRVIKRS